MHNGHFFAWHLLVQAIQAIVCGVIGFALAYPLTLLVSLLKAPKLVYMDQLATIGNLQEDNKRLESVIAERTHQFPPKLEAAIRKFIAEHPQSVTTMDRLMKSDELEDRELKTAQEGPALMASDILKSRQIRSYYGGSDHAYSISDLYRPIISYILYEEKESSIGST